MTAPTDLPESVVQRLGTTIADRYRLIRVLGVGGMGAVYEAHHVFTHRRVALKLLRSEQAFSTDAATRFLQEARAPSSIGHPNIVEVLDAGVDPSVGMYLALELLEGEDLGAAVERDGVDLRALLEVASQILGALAAAHAGGFVHRDIKPENVFVTRDAAGAVRARLLDFGIVRRVTADRGLTATGAVLGTPLYMSPEQARGEHVDARSDLWSMGAMLFHALSGSAPFDGSNVNVVMVALLTSAPPSLRDRRADLSPALCDVVDRALRVDPAERWQSAQEMAAALASVPDLADGVGLPTATTFRSYRAEAPVAAPAARPRRPVARALVAASLIVAVAGAAAAVVGARSPVTPARDAARAPSATLAAPAPAPTPIAPTPIAPAPIAPTEPAAGLARPSPPPRAPAVRPHLRPEARDSAAPPAAHPAAHVPFGRDAF